MAVRRFGWKGIRTHRDLDDTTGIRSPVVLALEDVVAVEREDGRG
jgi:hypothetical protein